MEILEILGKIGFDWRLAIANLINIGIIFLILQKFAWKPIKQKIEERETAIKKGLSQAQEAEIELKKAEEEREEIIKQAKRDAALILEEVEKQRKDLLTDAQAKAEKEREAILHKAEQEVSAKEQEMVRALNEKSAELISRGVERMLREEMTPEINERIIKNVVEKIG